MLCHIMHDGIGMVRWLAWSQYKDIVSVYETLWPESSQIMSNDLSMVRWPYVGQDAHGYSLLSTQHAQIGPTHVVCCPMAIPG